MRMSGPAPAKLNLVLEVLGRRADGYHELRSVMQTLALADDVTIDRNSDAPGITVGGDYAAGTPIDGTNLAWRAADALATAAGHEVANLRISIEKRLPPAGGVGGGASDAATTLRLLADAWQISDRQLLLEIANAIGSDEAFFLTGGTALVSGRGDRVQALPPIPPRDVVLFVPRGSIANKTGNLFEALGTTPFDDGSAAERFVRLHPRPIGVDDLFNAFERVAYGQFPELPQLKASIQAAIASPVRLAGAGPTLFWIGAPGGGPAIAAAARGFPCDVILTRTAN